MADVVLNPYSPLVSAPDPERQDMARRLARDSRMTYILTIVLLLLFSVFIVQRDNIFALHDWAMSVSDNPTVILALFVSVIVIMYMTLNLFCAYRTGYLLGRKYGLITRTASAWLIDYARSTGVALVYIVVFAEIFFWIVRASPNNWWIFVIALWWNLTLLLQYLWPQDRFGTRKLAPLEDPELSRRLSGLANQAGLTNLSLWILPWGKKLRLMNAWLMGAGKGRKIVLSDTMLEKFSYDELEAILSHEIAHAVKGDIRKALLRRGIAASITIFAAYLLTSVPNNNRDTGGVDDITMLLKMVTAFYMYFAFYYLNASWSRRSETKADRYAIELTGNPDAFKSAMIKLADTNLIQLRPQGIPTTHPSIADRIKMADTAAGNNLTEDTGWKRPASRVIRDKNESTARRNLPLRYHVRRIRSS